MVDLHGSVVISKFVTFRVSGEAHVGIAETCGAWCLDSHESWQDGFDDRRGV